MYRNIFISVLILYMCVSVYECICTATFLCAFSPGAAYLAICISLETSSIAILITPP